MLVHPEFAHVAQMAADRRRGRHRRRHETRPAAAPLPADMIAVRGRGAAAARQKARPVAVDVGALARYDRPMPDLADYDTLLVSTPCAGTA